MKSIPSHSLAVAIREAIQAHADRYGHGKIDLDRTMAALGEVSSDLAAEIPDRLAACQALQAMILGTLYATEWKRRERGKDGFPAIEKQ
jgi:hypothetical protein